MQQYSFSTFLTTISELPLRFATKNGYLLDQNEVLSGTDTPWSSIRTYNPQGVSADGIYSWRCALGNDNINVSHFSAQHKSVGSGLSGATKTIVRSDTQRIVTVNGMPVKTDFGRIKLEAVFPDLWTKEQIAEEIISFVTAIFDDETTIVTNMIIGRNSTIQV